MEVRRVVVVEDNPTDAEAVCRSLQKETAWRYECHIFGLAGEALHYLSQAENAPALLILDWKLPDATAPDVLGRLVGEEPIPPFPVVLLTGSTPPNADQLLRHGVQDFFEKSLLTLGLFPRIARNAIERHVLMRRLVESERAAAEAERVAGMANRAKSTFLANMSHELRTPLTAIIGITELLLEGSKSDADRGMLELILGSGQHLADVISDILDLTRVEAGTLRIQPAPCDPIRLLNELCEVLKYRAADKKLTLRVNRHSPVPTVELDPTRLRQILLNLVGNALKFTERGGVEIDVEFKVNRPVGALTFRVTDTGPGIAPEERQRVFERFVQLQQEGANVHNGVGLGLPISRSLARLMGGDLTLQSEVGRGSTFELTCAAPVVAAPTTAPPPRVASSIQNYEWDGRRILIVEDTAANEFLLRAFLEPSHATVESAVNGKQAVDAYRKAAAESAPHDVILMDMQLPVMDGFAATATLREEGCTAHIIAITAGAAVSDRERCLTSGCDGFIAKPFSRETVLKSIAEALESAQG